MFLRRGEQPNGVPMRERVDTTRLPDPEDGDGVGALRPDALDVPNQGVWTIANSDRVDVNRASFTSRLPHPHPRIREVRPTVARTEGPAPVRLQRTWEPARGGPAHPGRV